MKFVCAFTSALLLTSAPVLACADAVEAEDEFVACLAAKEPALIAKIRDADSEKAFVTALKEGVAVCPAEVDGMSMGKLFKALNAYKQGKSDA